MLKKRYYFLAVSFFLVVMTYILVLFGLKIYVENELNDYFSQDVKVNIQMPHLSFKKKYLVFPDITLKNSSENIDLRIHLCLGINLFNLFYDRNGTIPFDGFFIEELNKSKFNGSFKFNKIFTSEFNGSFSLLVSNIKSEQISKTYLKEFKYIEALGDVKYIDFLIKDFTNKEKKIQLNLELENGKLKSDFILSDTFLRSGLKNLTTLRVFESNAFLKSILKNNSRYVKNISFQNDSMVLNILGFDCPFSEGLQKLEIASSLELGSAEVHTDFSLLSFLDVFESKRAKIVEIEFDSINSNLKGQKLYFDQFKILIDNKWEMPIMGYIDFKNKVVDFDATIDARALSGKFLGTNSLDGITNKIKLGIMAKLKIKGHFDKIKVKLHPEWDLKKSLLGDIPNIVEEIFKGGSVIQDGFKNLGDDLKEIFNRKNKNE